MWYIFTCNIMCTRDILSKEMRIPLRYVCNNCYALFFNRKAIMDKQYFKEEIDGIQYINVNPPLFQILYYDIKAGKICVRTGKQIHFIVNKMFSCGFTIFPFINSDFTISPFHHYTIFSSHHFTISPQGWRSIVELVATISPSPILHVSLSR